MGPGCRLGPRAQERVDGEETSAGRTATGHHASAVGKGIGDGSRSAIELGAQRTLAHTTIGTMLAKMEEKGQVRHRSDGRVNIYRPLIRRDQVGQSMVNDLTDRLFGGDVKQMVCHLLDGNELTPQDLAELRRMIQQREKEIGDD